MYSIIWIAGDFYKIGDVLFEKDYDLNIKINGFKLEIELGSLVDYKGFL